MNGDDATINSRCYYSCVSWPALRAYLERLLVPCINQLLICFIFRGVHSRVEMDFMDFVDTCAFAAGRLLEKVVLATKFDLAARRLTLCSARIPIGERLNRVLACLPTRLQLDDRRQRDRGCRSFAIIPLPD